MSTGPGPTRKADGSTEASVDDIADLLVEDESHHGRMEGEQSLDDGLDVMLETPGPALVNTFLPPPPAPVTEDAEESESAEEPGESTNLAYEDLLAKLVLPAKVPEPEPTMPALAAPLPMPETLMAPAAPTPPAVAYNSSSSASFQLAPPTDERTLVTDNPLVAEEQEAAVREGRTGSREQPPLILSEMRPSVTEPLVGAIAGATKSRAFYLTAAVVLVVFGFFLAVVFLKVIAPAPQLPVVITPAPQPPPSAPPAHVEPLPPSEPPVAAAPAPAPAEQPAPAAENTTPPIEEAAAQNGDRPQPKSHRPAHKVAHATAPKAAPAPKVVAPATKPAAAAAPKVASAPAPAAKPAKAPSGKKGKSSGYADPFDN